MKKWLSALGIKLETKTEEPVPPAPKVYQSPALNLLHHQLRHNRKYHILDLAPACGTNVDFFSQFACKIYIEDLHRTLTSFDFLSPEDGFSYEKVFEYLLPYWKNTQFDVIMVWDLFNYLEIEEFEHLVQHLAQFCRTGTLLFALISTRKYISERPTSFKIIDHNHLLYENNSTVLRRCPKYQQSDLTQVMPNFEIGNSFLLRNGFKEYLFSCK